MAQLDSHELPPNVNSTSSKVQSIDTRKWPIVGDLFGMHEMTKLPYGSLLSFLWACVWEPSSLGMHAFLYHCRLLLRWWLHTLEGRIYAFHLQRTEGL